ncbi:MAG: hypothetical protein AAB903_03655 [Patescibacteria group bacterium]
MAQKKIIIKGAREHPSASSFDFATSTRLSTSQDKSGQAILI